jgi:chemotaxis signal transduction protein
MSGLAQEGGTNPETGLRSRWLVFAISDRKVAVSLEHMVIILKRAEIFPVPMAGKEFKGIFYYNDKAVPVLNWEFLTGKSGEPRDQGILILEQSDDLLGIEIDEVAKVEQHPFSGETGEPGFWIDLDPGRGLWALNVGNLFKALRKV